MTAGTDAAPTLTIVIVSYNTRQMTLDCIASVYAETRDTDFEVIVVDNESADGSAEAIEREHPGVLLIRAGANLGFAPANNLAAERARGRYLLLLNPDTVVLDRAVDRLMAFARSRPEAGIWGGRTLDGARRLDPSSCWRDMDLWNLSCRAAGLTGIFPRSPLFNAEAYGGWLRDTEREVDIVTGCLLLIETDFWRRLGGFDPTFVMYGEEADLCRRARAAGARPRITPDVEIIHYGGASETVRADKMVRLLRAKSALIIKHWRGPRRALGLWLMRMWPLTRSVAAAVRGDASVWREIWRRRDEWRRGFEGAPTPLAPAPGSTAD